MRPGSKEYARQQVISDGKHGMSWATLAHLSKAHRNAQQRLFEMFATPPTVSVPRLEIPYVR